MRILHVLTQADTDGAYGGPVTVALAQCRASIEAGHTAEVVAGWVADEPAPATLDGVPAQLFRARPLFARMPFVTQWSWALVCFLRREVARFDVVHIHLARELLPTSALVVAVRRRVPVVVQPHGMLGGDRRAAARLLEAPLRRLWSRAAGALALSADEARDLTRLGVGRGPAIVLPNAAPAPPSRTVPLAERPREVLFLARLHPRKQVLLFAAMARLLVRRGTTADFAVCGPDGGDLPALLAYVEREGLGDRVRYEGAVARSEVAARLGRARVCVAPALDEPFGMVLAEAMAAGTPTVSVRPGGLAARIEAAGAGLVVESDAGELAAAVTALLDDDALWEQTAARGSSFAAGALPASAWRDVLLATYTDAVLGR